METINFTDTKPKEIKVENFSKITFGKVFFTKGVENKSGLSLMAEFKSPTGHYDAEGKPEYNIKLKPLNIGTLIDVMDMPHSTTIKINKSAPIPKGCTIINLSANNSLSNEFDIEIEVQIN
jgi:hypothetical protein